MAKWFSKISQMSPATRMIIIFSVVTVVLFALVGYFAFIYQRVPVERIAHDFCTCTANPEVTGSKYERSREGFQYASGLNQCFAESFKYYDDDLTLEEELEYVEKIREEIFKQCPDQLEKVFAR